MAEPGESLIPGDDVDARVDAAVASALAPSAGEAEEVAMPIGATWAFDFEQRRLVRDGSGAVRVSGDACLAQWCMMAMHSTRFAHDVFSEAFGIESLEDIIGQAMIGELSTEFEARMRDALMVHDRVVAMEDYSVDFNPAEDALIVDTFTVITDEEDRVSVDGGTLTLGEVV